jgi:hypothetical protein
VIYITVQNSVAGRQNRPAAQEPEPSPQDFYRAGMRRSAIVDSHVQSSSPKLLIAGEAERDDWNSRADTTPMEFYPIR